MEQLNTIEAANFAEMKDNLTQLDTFMEGLHKQGSRALLTCPGWCGLVQYANLIAVHTGEAMQPYLAQIDELDNAVGDLEHLVDALDRASWQLGIVGLSMGAASCAVAHLPSLVCRRHKIAPAVACAGTVGTVVE